MFWQRFAVRYPYRIHCITLSFINVRPTIATCHFVNVLDSLPFMKSYVTITNHAATIFGGDS